MSAENIEYILLVTTPPSNFEAKGNPGIMNIVLKTNADLRVMVGFRLEVKGYKKTVNYKT